VSDRETLRRAHNAAIANGLVTRARHIARVMDALPVKEQEPDRDAEYAALHDAWTAHLLDGIHFCGRYARAGAPPALDVERLRLALELAHGDEFRSLYHRDMVPGCVPCEALRAADASEPSRCASGIHWITGPNAEPPCGCWNP
jgi:hypothetical protein